MLIALQAITAMTVHLTAARSAWQGTTATRKPSSPIKRALIVSLDTTVLKGPSYQLLVPTANTPWSVLSQKMIVMTVSQGTTAFVSSHPQQ